VAQLGKSVVAGSATIDVNTVQTILNQKYAMKGIHKRQVHPLQIRTESVLFIAKYALSP
jgi:hypothetical protein